MKEFKYIYTLLIAMLLGIISFACTDEEDTEQLEKGDDTTDVRGGRFITTTITVSTAAPDLSVDLEGTRAGNDKANIEHDQTENGGRFQNVVVVVTNDKDSVYAIHCNKWYGDRPTSTGVKQYEVIFPDVQIYTTNGEKAKVYAFGNVDMDRWNTINGYTVEATRKLISEYAEINNLITADLSVINDDIYNIRFVPESGNYKVGDDEVTNTCTGMPVNGTADAEVKKGATKFSVHMRRVCARLQVTFRNFTGTYKDYQTKENKPNNVYVDEFVIKKVLAKKTNYFHDSVAKGNNYTPSEPGDVDFNILNALGGSKTNDHDINKIENGNDLTVSMYVFENKKGTASGDYTYNLKVDRGKSLGTDTRTFQEGNVYVIWNMGKERSIAYNNKVTVSSVQTEKENVPFMDQVFWQLELGSTSASHTEGNKTYTLKHYPIDLETDLYDISKDNNEVVYFSKQSGSSFNSSPVLNPGNNNSKKQYVWFETTNQAQYQINLCYSITDGQFSIRYYCLTVNGSSKFENTAKTWPWEHWYDWTIYAKYIIKSDKFGEGKDGAVTQYKKITRNSSYSMDFSVMPNYNTKQELLVNCVRDQKTISWESVDK